MSLICPVAKCKAKKGPCTCEQIAAVIAGIAVFAFLYMRILAES